MKFKLLMEISAITFSINYLIEKFRRYSYTFGTLSFLDGNKTHGCTECRATPNWAVFEEGYLYFGVQNEYNKLYSYKECRSKMYAKEKHREEAEACL